MNNEPGTDAYEKSRDHLLDTFDLGMMQEKAHALCIAPCDPFIRKLSVRVKTLERSFELANEL